MNLSPDKRLIHLLQALSPTDAQNRLLRITDRNLAMCMLYMDKNDQTTLLACLGKIKRKRVQQEIEYVTHLRVRYPQYRAVIEQVINSVISGKDAGPRSYIRPIKND